jgi:leishmanolysin
MTADILSVTQEQLSVTVSRCFDIDVPPGDRNVFVNYDMVIYATAEAAGSSFFANAVACQLRVTDPRRPLVGRIKYNTDLVGADVITKAGFQVVSRVAMHELIHVLGFSSTLYKYWSQTEIFTTQGSRTYMQTPKVKQAVKEYFQCSGPGMPLEDNGGAGSLGSHWEMQAINDEIMAAQFSSDDTLYLSGITLALLQDTGFFTSVNLEFSESKYMRFGRNRGCDFLSMDKCDLRPEFCSSGNGITFYATALGHCSSNTFVNTCKVFSAYTNRICKSASYSGFYGNLNTGLESNGWQSRGHMATVVSLSFNAPAAP